MTGWGPQKKNTGEATQHALALVGWGTGLELGGGVQEVLQGRLELGWGSCDVLAIHGPHCGLHVCLPQVAHGPRGLKGEKGEPAVLEPVSHTGRRAGGGGQEEEVMGWVLALWPLTLDV